MSAYDGGVNGISSAEYQQIAATIATVEARHASYLTFATGKNGFPAAEDTVLTAPEAFQAASQFITGCQYDVAGLAQQVMTPFQGEQYTLNNGAAPNNNNPVVASTPNPLAVSALQTSPASAVQSESAVLTILGSAALLVFKLLL